MQNPLKTMNMMTPGCKPPSDQISRRMSASKPPMKTSVEESGDWVGVICTQWVNSTESAASPRTRSRDRKRWLVTIGRAPSSSVCRGRTRDRQGRVQAEQGQARPTAHTESDPPRRTRFGYRSLHGRLGLGDDWPGSARRDG